MLQTIKNLIFPNTCLICNQIIDSGYLCGEHFNKLQFLSKPACKICFHPFEFKIDDEMICPKCLAKKPPYNQAQSVFKYDETSKIIITKFKYHDNTHLAKYIAKIIYNHCQEILRNNINFITAVPLYKKRLRKRKYNQSALIASQISKLTNIKIIYDILIRTKNTAPQTTLNQKLRSKNLAKAFITNAKYQENIKGKNILLIDDVITSGATIEACCKVLRKQKVNKIYVLSLAKTVID